MLPVSPIISRTHFIPLHRESMSALCWISEFRNSRIGFPHDKMQETERKHIQFVCWLELLLKAEGCVGGGCERIFCTGIYVCKQPFSDL